MKIILTKDVEYVGDMGDVVKVKDGYARNFLLPRKLAIPFTPKLQKWADHIRSQRQAKEKKLLTEAEKRQAEIEKVSLEFQVKAGEEGKLYGSVTSAQIERALLEKGLEVDKKQIVLRKPIKKIGEYIVSVKVYRQVVASVKVVVKPEEAKPVEKTEAVDKPVEAEK